VECRSGGSTHDFQLIVTFATNVTVTGRPPPDNQAQVTEGIGQVGSGGTYNGGFVTVNGAVVTVPLTNINNAQKITVTLYGVNDGSSTANVSIPMGILLGDVTLSRRTDSGDVAATRSHAISVPTDNTTARFDVNLSGRIDSGDVTTVRNNTITFIP
jgi:hypothetical protein